MSVKMDSAAARHSDYALGHSEQELERLSHQGQVFAPFTRQLFEQAGVRPGMRVLDVGSGAGDVAFLAAELVGPSGEVIGADREVAAVKWATARAHARDVTNVKFLVNDPAEMEFDRKFDAVVGRLVLMYYPDPVAALAKLVRHLRPEGLVIFQEFEMENMRSLPPAPTVDRAASWMKQTLSASGARTQIGLELYQLFLAAGLPGPQLRMDTLVGGGAGFPYELLAGVIESLLPVMEKLKIGTAADVDISTLAERMRDEVAARNGVVIAPALIGAWSPKTV
jgi:SAM-dependent methyltransferase